MIYPVIFALCMLLYFSLAVYQLVVTNDYLGVVICASIGLISAVLFVVTLRDSRSSDNRVSGPVEPVSWPHWADRILSPSHPAGALLKGLGASTEIRGETVYISWEHDYTLYNLSCDNEGQLYGMLTRMIRLKEEAGQPNREFQQQVDDMVEEYFSRLSGD